jgi:hypothetical protein
MLGSTIITSQLSSFSGQKPGLSPKPIPDNLARCLRSFGQVLGSTICGDFVALDTKRVLDDLGGAVGIVGAIARSSRLVMRVLLADDRTQTQHKNKSLGGTDKSPDAL